MNTPWTDHGATPWMAFRSAIREMALRILKRALERLEEISRIWRTRWVDVSEDEPAVSFDALVDELSRVLWNAEKAIAVAIDAGFPRASLPTFSTSRVFWTHAVEEARNGVVEAGVGALVAVVAKRYPGNLVFQRYRVMMP